MVEDFFDALFLFALSRRSWTPVSLFPLSLSCQSAISDLSVAAPDLTMTNCVSRSLLPDLRPTPISLVIPPPYNSLLFWIRFLCPRGWSDLSHSRERAWFACSR